MKYWIGRNNQQLGPFEVSDIQKMIVEGKIATTDLAWTEGMPTWAPVAQVIPGAGPSTAMDLGKTQPVLGQFNRMQPAPAPEPAAAPVPAPTPAPAPAPTPAPAAAPVTPKPAASPMPWEQPAPTPAAAPVAAPMAPKPSPMPWEQPAAPQAPAPYNPAPAPYNPAPAQQQPQWAQPGAPVPGQFGPPGGMAPQYQQGAMGSPTPGGGPVPPGMNWIIVLLLGFIPLVGSLFSIYWVFKQYSFVKQIDAANKSLMLVGAGFGCIILYVLLLVMGAMMGDTMTAILGGIGMLFMLAGLAAFLMAVFGARASLLKYYNTVEPIGLKLSPVMTFFFNMYYFQYHFQRIAEWKGGAPLRPQA